MNPSEYSECETICSRFGIIHFITITGNDAEKSGLMLVLLFTGISSIIILILEFLTGAYFE